jgi:hypothetical protein
MFCDFACDTLEYCLDIFDSIPRKIVIDECNGARRYTCAFDVDVEKEEQEEDYVDIEKFEDCEDYDQYLIIKCAAAVK